MSFRITGLPAQRFAHLFALSDEQLAAQGAVRRIADGRVPGYPCRVSLTDSREGDELILVNYEHHGVNSPYRMRFAIYVRAGETTYDAIDEVPAQLRARTLAVRAFDHDAMMVGCEMVDGRDTPDNLSKNAEPRRQGRDALDASYTATAGAARFDEHRTQHEDGGLAAPVRSIVWKLPR